MLGTSNRMVPEMAVEIWEKNHDIFDLENWVISPQKSKVKLVKKLL